MFKDAGEGDRYDLQCSLASPVRSPQRYSPSVHPHQVKLSKHVLDSNAVLKYF